MKKNLLLVMLIMCIGLLFSAYKVYNEPEYEDISFNGEFKNLRVLPQNISKDSLMGLMRGYNKALGVKCNHCHAEDKSSDEKHEKEITRHMIKFTDELNAKEFAPLAPKYKTAIQCATCHRGSTKPMDDTKSFMNPKEK